jgi:hypothetical protein
MNPVPPLTTILMKFLLSGGAEQTISLARARAFARYGFYSSRMLKKSATRVLASLPRTVKREA